MKKYLKSQTLWSDLNNTEKVAADAAAHEVKFKQTPVEEAVRKFVNYYNQGNAEPEYENEDFFMEEADYNKVLDYVKQVTITASASESKKHNPVLSALDLQKEVVDDIRKQCWTCSNLLNAVAQDLNDEFSGGTLHRLSDILDLIEKNVDEAYNLAENEAHKFRNQ